MEQNRLINIDYLKVYAMALVVLGHLPITNISLRDWIFTFHVPLFFFLSGYLCKVERDWDDKTFLKRNFLLLIIVTVPYFLVGLIYNGMMDYVFYPNKFGIDNNLVCPIKNYLLANSKIGPMWFLVSLFWMRLLYNYLSKLLKSRYKNTILLGSLVLSVMMVSFNVNIYEYQISSTIIAFPFYCLGVKLKSMDFSTYVTNFKVSIPIAIVLFILSKTLLPLSGSINISSLSIGNNIFAFYLSSLVGIAFSFVLFYNVNKTNNFVTTISSGTLVILCSQFWLIQPAKVIYKKLAHI